MEYKNELMKGKCIMKNVSKKTIKASNGITLIALVITIIVLLILARNKYFNAKSGITLFYKKQRMLKQEVMKHK